MKKMPPKPHLEQKRSTPLPKPEWLKVDLRHLSGSFLKTKRLMQERSVHTVCDAALCPNRGDCYSRASASFLILGRRCTRHCAFCHIDSATPDPLDPNEPERLAQTVQALGLRYVVITSVTRDDLEEGGAQHFAHCVEAIKAIDETIEVEILVPDFKQCQARALEILQPLPIAVFNHNIETAPSLYPRVRAGADFETSLHLLNHFSLRSPKTPIKSGIMLGLGESDLEVEETLVALYEHGCRILTLGQYLQPSRQHYPVQRYLPPSEFDDWHKRAREIGFKAVASAPMVRSSYRASELYRLALKKD